MHTYKLRTQEAEAGASCFEGQPELHSEILPRESKQAAKYSLKNVSVMKLWHSYRKRKRLSGLLLVQPKNQFTLTTEWAVFI